MQPPLKVLGMPNFKGLMTKYKNYWRKWWLKLSEDSQVGPFFQYSVKLTQNLVQFLKKPVF
jgi:hypothetical protein